LSDNIGILHIQKLSTAMSRLGPISFKSGFFGRKTYQGGCPIALRMTRPTVPYHRRWST